MELLVEAFSWIAILAGCFFLFVGAIGTYRFPNFWTRLHAVSVTDSAGMLLLTLGMVIQAGFTLVALKLVFIGIFLLITGPTATHAVANAALVTGDVPDGVKAPKMDEEMSAAIAEPGKKTATKPKSKPKAKSTSTSKTKSRSKR